MKKKLTIPPKANMALYWSRVWLKMQRKGITPATKNLEMVIMMNMEGEWEEMGKKEETFSWFVAWQALKRMTCRADSQEWIDKMVLLWKIAFVPNFHLYFSNHYFIFSRHDKQTIFLKYIFGEIFVTPSIFFNAKASPGTNPNK